MGIIKTIMTSLLVLSCCSCGSNDNANPIPLAKDLKSVDQSIAYDDTTPGNASQDIMYTESWLISSATMTVTRSGGAQVNSGAWAIELNQDEVTDINAHIALVTNPEVKDYVNDYILYDGPCTNLNIGAVKKFHYGMVADPITNTSQWHQFPAEADNLVSYLEQLMIAHIGDQYK